MNSTKQPIITGIVDLLTAVPLFVIAPLCRPWHMRWGATSAEVQCAMPGDELVPHPSFNATRALTIEACPNQVWPWIVQMGYGRGGFYSYDLLDNAGRASGDQILDQFQQVRVGDWMPMAGRVNSTTAFKVTGFALNEWLLWQKPDSTWAWRLISLEGGRTRLVTRLKQRYQWEAPLLATFSVVLLEFGDFPMMRKALLGIKQRAEQTNRALTMTTAQNRR
ncbi:MAG: hypothetical protein KDE19_25045 [Caldilineaceae bacterium]|nr:hypothetical protein [Caldilineaceae bacterium]